MVLVMPCAKVGPARLRRRGQHLRRDQPVEEAPALGLLAAERTAGVEQLAGAAVADQARQDRARAHVAAGQPDAVEQERRPAARGADAQVGRHRQDRAGAGAHAVDRGDDRLRAGAHRLDDVAGHAREHQQLGRRQPDQRADDLVHVAAGTEVVAGALQHDDLDVVGVAQPAEQVAQLA
jgi:hypothetical protein